MIRDRLWNAVLDPQEDPRRITKACEILLQTLEPEESLKVTEPKAAQRFMNALSQ